MPDNMHFNLIFAGVLLLLLLNLIYSKNKFLFWLFVFYSSLKRSIYGVFNGTTSIRDDIELQIFAGDEYVFANATINPENADFCTPLGNCLGAGFFNMTNCLKSKNINFLRVQFIQYCCILVI